MGFLVRRHRVLVAGAVVCLLACHQNRETEPARHADGGTGPSIPRVSKVRPLILRLASKDEKQMRAARAELRTWKDAKAPSTSGAIELLRASANVFPAEKPEEALNYGIGNEIIEVVSETPRPEFRPVIEEIFPRLKGRSREQALSLLSIIDDDAAAASFVRLLTANADTVPGLSLLHLRERPHHADVFFPGLLDLTTHHAIADELYLTALEFCLQKKLTTEKLAPRASALVVAYRTERDWLLPRQQSRGIAWMWADQYPDHRQTAEILLDLAGFLPLAEVEKDLTGALGYRDPRLLYFALKALLAHGRPLATGVVATVAASPEVRNLLFDHLKDKDLTELMPARYRTQAALAESNMVRWLVYPTELGRAPDQIEMKKVLSIDTESDDGILDYYLFRFRTLPPHWAAKDGWMAGVAGPFVRKESPTTDSNGGTFSDFEPWASRTPAEHMGDVQELLEGWRQSRKESSSDDD